MPYLLANLAELLENAAQMAQSEEVAKDLITSLTTD